MNIQEKYINAENIKDTIKSEYNISNDIYIDDEKYIIKNYVYNRITKGEMIEQLKELYKNY